MFKIIFTCLMLLSFAAVNTYTQDQTQNFIFTTIETLANLQSAGIITVNNEAGFEQQSDSAEYLTIQIKLSADGNAIVDEQGNEIARFKEGTEFKAGEKEMLSIKGCLRCEWKCVSWDSQGNCFQLKRICTWDPNCGSK